MQNNRYLKMGGVGDEAGASLENQVEALSQLGWDYIDLRNINGVPVAELSDETFQQVTEALTDSGLKVSSLCSRIGNWQRTISSSFSDDSDELALLIERAQSIGAPFIRIMSYPNDGSDPRRWREVSLNRVSKLVAQASRADLCLLHENCSGWAAQGLNETLDMLRTINSPFLGILFDFGNWVGLPAYSLEWLKELRPWIRHLHIKDGQYNSDGSVDFVWPGAGHSQLARGLSLLLESGYQGVLCIEPHLLHQPHLGLTDSDDVLRKSFVEYGRALEQLLLRLKKIDGDVYNNAGAAEGERI